MSNPEHHTSPLRHTVLLMAAVALAITLLRLLGEVRHWDPLLFGSDAGGGGALVGIGWLILAFGALAGRQLQRIGRGPADARRAWTRTGLGVVTPLAGFILVVTAIGPTPFGMIVGAGACIAGAIIAAPAWPELARASLLFALLCRIPILVITPFAIANDWGTHYEKLAPGSPELEPLTRTLVLCMAQVIFWIPITILGAQLAALVSLKKRKK